MFDVFKQYVSAKTTLSKEDWAFIEPLCQLKRLRRQQYLLQEGDVWRYNAFICQGCLRRYRIDDKGAEHIIQFSPEHWWAGDRQSLMTGAPSNYNIDAVEDSTVLLIREEDFQKILKHIPAFKEMTDMLLFRSLNASQERIHAAISLTAEEKYLDFLRSFPQLGNRIPRHMLAAYLGIKPETLSRVRKQLAGK